jgi:presenilin-like A22 family membrane protease
VPIAATVLAAAKLIFAVDHLYDTVSYDLASRYCPLSKSVFLGRLGALLAAFAGIAFLLFLLARFRAKDARRKELGYIGACAIAVFAIGSSALVILGLSGCRGGTEAGLTWDWPW